MRAKCTPTALLCFVCLFSHAQSDSVSSVKQLSELSLEQLMNTPIYSVSKSDESTFDAPLSSSVVTHDEIKRAGCTSIMEALRLVPGVIVEQQTNGNYDIHIRGMDNVIPNSGMYFHTNSTTLVMIDGRPVYNYVQGGTFWETLPVDLNDVDKIEVVRGPAAAMYGPNAESGVINIITRQPKKKGVYVVANGQYGNYNTGIANASVGYNVNNKFSVIASGNFQNRNRTENDYYSVTENKFVPLDTFVTNDSVRNKRYPHPNLAMRKYGYNVFLNYNINDRASISLQGGGQNSEVQDEFASNFLTTAQTTSYYANLKASVYGLNLQGSYLAGTQAPQIGVLGGKWDFSNTDVVLDYNMTAIKHLVITPGLSYRMEIYNDSKYTDVASRGGVFNGQVKSYTVSGMLRADWKLFHEKLRLLASGRVDKFNAPAKIYGSWNFAITYKLTDKHLLRIVESRANQCPLLLNNYFNYLESFPGVGSIQLLGNTNLNLLTTDMLEIGYRGKIKDNLEVDLEVFGSTTKNFMTENLTTFDTTGKQLNFIYHFQNIPLIERQIGATLSVNYIIGKFQLKPFITVQHTILFNYSPYNTLPTVITTAYTPNVATENINSGMGTQMAQAATPTVYGGAYINFEITSHLNLNLNPYFMSSSTQTLDDNLTYHDGTRGVENISPKFIMNISVSYTFFKKLTLFANFKNCFSDKTREFYRGDIPGFQVSGGVNFEL